MTTTPEYNEFGEITTIQPKPPTPTQPHEIRGIYDLPIFDWAWTEDARDTERS